MSTSRLQSAVAFADDRLVVGCGTVLWDPEPSSSKVVTLGDGAARDRMVALLAVAGRGHLAKAALLQLDAALDEWRRGDRALAAIRLAFARLPGVRDLEEAHALFLAETALDGGFAANDLLKELGYESCLPLLKDYRTQPRVPSGSGRESGQWTSDAPCAGFAPLPGPASFTPIADGDGVLRPTPVLLRPKGGDAEEDIDEKARRLLDDSVEERIREGRPLPKEVPGGFEIVPVPELAPAAPPPKAPNVGVTDPDVPTTGPLPVPIPIPIPSGDGPSFGDRARDKEGPACPVPQTDRPRGPNANADLYEWQMSQLVNPLNPTPKALPSTPGVASLAYYLATPTPDGKTSYDDCKKDDTPISIPGVRQGDMFEFKSKNFSWPLFYTNSVAYKEFYRQFERQNEGVDVEGKGRKVFYCFDDYNAASRASLLLHKDFPNSRFLKCN